MTEPVRVRDCACPGTPHDEEGDVVFLASKLPAEGGIVAEQQMSGAKDDDDITRKWLITFVRYGATGWNLQDENGPTPFDVEDLLADWALARPVALRAGELYLASVAAPFQKTPAKPSRTGRTRATTSARPSPIPSSSA
jgi:hypothetical protein